MSFSSYNVKINNVATPYISACSELGSFNGKGFFNDGAAYSGWNSLTSTLFTNNGIATIISNNVLQITNAGVYKISVSVDCLGCNNSSGDAVSCFFAFSTSLNSNTSPPTGFFGGDNNVWLTNVGQQNTSVNPGIISWITVANSSYGGSVSSLSPSIYISNTEYGTYYSFNHQVNGDGQSYPGICTTELCFTISAPISLYFNVSGNNANTVLMGTSYFVLQLLSTTPFPTPAQVPTINDISPTSGSNATLVTITGTNLNNNLMHVYFGNNSANLVSFSSTTITCYPPYKDSGPFPVTVVTNGGTSNNNNSFTYNTT